MKVCKKMVTMVLVCAIFVSGLMFIPTNVQAATQKEVQRKITAYEKQLKQLKSTYKKQLKKEKKQRRGGVSIYGEVISRNPMIIRNLDGSYYWVENCKYLTDAWVYAGGTVKLTGKYKTYNGIYTCAVCNSMKVSNASVKTKQKIEKINKKITKCKRALKDKYTLFDTEIKVGQKQTLDGSWKYLGFYNTLSWKSSDNSIASIDQKGRLTAKKAGKVTISVKASASEITTKQTYTIMGEPTSVTLSEQEVTMHTEYNYHVALKVITNPAKSVVKSMVWSSSDPNVATVTQDGDVYSAGAGKCTITVVVNGKLSATCQVTVEQDESEIIDDTPLDYPDFNDPDDEWTYEYESY